MPILLEACQSTLQAPDLLGTLRDVAEFGKDAGQRLRAARENLGLSQFEAAVKLEVTEKTVGKWERAQAKPTRNGHWDRIEKVYGVSRRDILGEPEPAQLDRIENEQRAIRQLLEQILASGPSQISEALDAASEGAEKKRGGGSAKPAPKKSRSRRAS